MPATTFDIDTPIGRMYVYLYAVDGELTATIQDEMSRHVGNWVTPVTIDRIPVMFNWNLRTDLDADMTNPNSWRFGICSTSRIGTLPTEVLANPSTDSQRRTIRRTILDILTGLFVQHEDLVFAVIVSSQAADFADLRREIAAAEETLAALRVREAEDDARLSYLRMMLEPSPSDLADLTAFQAHRAKVFGLRGGN